jgi:hypothetical protein
MRQTQEQTQMTQPQETASADRVSRFRADVAEMRLRDPKAGRDRMWLFVGGAMMAIIAYFQSSGAASSYRTEGPATQRDAIVIAMIGISVAVVGAALFLRYSLAQFLRFWLARLIYEQHAQTDRIVGDSAAGNRPAGRAVESR